MGHVVAREANSEKYLVKQFDLYPRGCREPVKGLQQGSCSYVGREAEDEGPWPPGGVPHQGDERSKNLWTVSLGPLKIIQNAVGLKPFQNKSVMIKSRKFGLEYH